MLSRYVSAGILLLAGAQALSAADPLVPPAPSRDDGQAIPVPSPMPAPNSVPLPPAPGLKAEKLLPVPETNIPGTVVQPSHTAQPQSISPQMVAPPVYTQPLTSGTFSYPQGGTMVAPQVPTMNAPYYSNAPMGSYSQPTSNFDPYASQGVMNSYPQNNGFSQYAAPQYNSFSTGQFEAFRFQSGPAGGEHARYPYYSYRRPWYSPGPVSRNVNIVW